MRNSKANLIHCVGDSHASFFSGTWDIQPEWPLTSTSKLEGVFNYRIGAPTAHNLINPNSSTQSWQRLWEVLATIPPTAENLILMSFGEIDCRAHLLRVQSKTKLPLEQLIARTIERYMLAVNKVIHAGYRVALWAPVATTRLEGNPEYSYIYYGSTQERNETTRLFNRQLQAACNQAGVPMISIFESLLSSTGQTRTEYYTDDIHLGPLALPLASKAIESACIGFRIPIPIWMAWAAPVHLSARKLRQTWKRIRLHFKKRIHRHK